MKKLILAGAIVASAMIASAASFDWKTSATGKIYESGSTATLLASGTAYIFDNATVTQQAVLSAFFANGTMASGSLSSKAVSAGVIAATAAEDFAWGTAGQTLTAFIAVISGDEIFISETQPKAAQDVGYAQFSFSEKTASQAVTLETSTFSAAGWYATSSPIPEPTSGLLLLLGMAGLALKRKRA